MYDDKQEEEYNFSQLLSDEEQESIYLTQAEAQKEKFMESVQSLIKNYLKERKDIRDSFYLVTDRSVYNDVFRELYNTSIRAVTEYFGIRRIP